MGLSSKPKSTSTSYSGSSNPQFTPQALAAAGDVQSVFNANQPHLQSLTNQADAISAAGMQNYKNGLPNLNASNGFYGDVLSGKYLDSNPYTQQMLGSIRNDVMNSVNSNYELAGRYGSGAHDNAVAQGIASAEAPILYGNYNQGLDRMGQAAGAAQQANLANLAGALAPIGLSAELPYTGSNNLANSLGALFNGGSSKATQTGDNPIWGAIGAGLGAAGAAFSDRRLKTNIEKVGEFADGLGIYTWNWKSHPNGHKMRGVIADEVKALRPHAYIENYQGSGFAGVNYGAL